MREMPGSQALGLVGVSARRGRGIGAVVRGSWAVRFATDGGAGLSGTALQDETAVAIAALDEAQVRLDPKEHARMASAGETSPDPSQATCRVFTLKTSGGGKAFAALACSSGLTRAPASMTRG